MNRSPSRARSRVPLGAMLVALALLLPLLAAAQVPARRIGVNWRDGVPYLDFSARDLATTAVRKKLDGGLPQRIVMQVAAFRSSDNAPVALVPQSCRVTRQYFEERYRVQVTTGTAAPSLESISTLDGVVRRCLEVRGIQVGQRSTWVAHHAERVYFAVLIEFNPLSTRTVEQIRRWLANSGGGPAQGEAFFGSFVSLFASRHIAGSAEHVLRFRSQPVRVP